MSIHLSQHPGAVDAVIVWDASGRSWILERRVIYHVTFPAVLTDRATITQDVAAGSTTDVVTSTVASGTFGIEQEGMAHGCMEITAYTATGSAKLEVTAPDGIVYTIISAKAAIGTYYGAVALPAAACVDGDFVFTLTATTTDATGVVTVRICSCGAVVKYVR